MKNRSLKVITLSVATSSLLFAANLNIDNIEKNIIVPKEVEKIQQAKKEPMIEIGGVQKYAPVMKDDGSGKRILVIDFEIDGNTKIRSDELKKLLGNYINQELTFAKLQEASSIITKEYRNKGYFVARAYIPVQDIKANNGIIKITVIEGSYGEFKLTNNSLVKDSIIQGMFDDAKNRGNVVSTDTLERSMLIINDTPGAKVIQADVRPGEVVGTSDFVVAADKGALYDWYVIADNYGSLYTGKNRLMAGMNFNSPAGLGDKLALSGLISNGADLKNYRVGYSLPLLPNGLRGELSYSNTNYDLVKLGATTPDNAYDGKSSTIEGSITYPIIKTRLETLSFNASYALKDMSDYFNDAMQKDRDVKVGTFGLSQTKNQTLLGFDAKTVVDGSFTIGRLNIIDQTSSTIDENGAQTEGFYSKANLNLSANIAFTQTLSMSGALKTQYAFNDKNLDGSEDISIGGSNGVKVFSDGEHGAENGYVFNTELFTSLEPINNISHKIGFFYERGYANMSDSSKDTQFKQRTLQDIGIGYYVNYKDTFVKVQLARVVGPEKISAETNGNISRLLLQAGWVF